jgi:hypothetical protein
MPSGTLNTAGVVASGGVSVRSSADRDERQADVVRLGRVSRRALRREVNPLLAELDQANPGILDRRDRERWTAAMLDRLWRDLNVTE